MTDPGEPSTGLPRVPVTDREASILAALARDRDVLEIGTGLGVSTRALASTAFMVTTVDIDPWVQETIWPDLPPNVARITHLSLIRGQFDLVFIDGDHSTAQVAADIHEAEQLCRPCGLLVAHDVNYRIVSDALDERWFVISTEHGLGVRVR